MSSHSVKAFPLNKTPLYRFDKDALLSMFVEQLSRKRNYMLDINRASSPAIAILGKVISNGTPC